jgi:hypothetical protein
VTVALYIPAARRRRRLYGAAIGALCLGLIGGVLIGRATVPTVQDRIATVQADARSTAGGLRVLSLHEQAGVSTGSTDEIDLVLTRTETELRKEFRDAGWLSATATQRLITGLNALRATPDRTGPAFATATDTLARDIESTFGLS